MNRPEQSRHVGRNSGREKEPTSGSNYCPDCGSLLVPIKTYWPWWSAHKECQTCLATFRLGKKGLKRLSHKFVVTLASPAEADVLCHELVLMQVRHVWSADTERPTGRSRLSRNLYHPLRLLCKYARNRRLPLWPQAYGDDTKRAIRLPENEFGKLEAIVRMTEQVVSGKIKKQRRETTAQAVARLMAIKAHPLK